MINDINANINDFNTDFTLNLADLPNDVTKSDIKWNNLKNLVRKNIKSRLTNIALRMYKWTLPDYLNERVIEYGFLTRGWVTVFKDPLGIFALPCIPNNMYNIYGEPTQVQAMGYNGWNELVDIKYFVEYPQVEGMNFIVAKDNRYGVVARDNYDNKRYIDYIQEYTETLTNLKLAMMVASETLKQPHITLIPKKALKQTAQKVINKIQNNEKQIILVDEDIKKVGGQSLKDMIQDIDMSGNVEAPQKLAEMWNIEFNMFLETLGINTNPSPDKAEVVLTPELNSNNSLIDLEQDVRFLNRQKLCDDAKKVLGIDIKVEKNLDEMKNLIGGMQNGTMEQGEQEDNKSGSTSQDSK